MLKKSIIIFCIFSLMFLGCGHKNNKNIVEDNKNPVEIQVFAAASLRPVMEELIQVYHEKKPECKILLNADSSGKLMTQIEEGFDCDIFFSASQRQMDELQKEHLIVTETRRNVLRNQVCLISRKDSGTHVIDMNSLSQADSIALADGSVPVGQYTRVALIRQGILKNIANPSAYPTEEISKQLGGVDISEQGNVSQVLTAVTEGACEVGTVYFSDIFGYEKELRIIQKIDSSLTGDVLYPIAQIKHKEMKTRADEEAQNFIHFILSDRAKDIFQKYFFDTEI